MATTTTTTTKGRSTWSRTHCPDGTPMLPAEPFRAWLRQLMADRGLTIEDVSRTCSTDARAIGRWLGRWDAGPTIAERVVEKAGISLVGDPRLAAQLYPELDY